MDPDSSILPHCPCSSTAVPTYGETTLPRHVNMRSFNRECYSSTHQHHYHHYRRFLSPNRLTPRSRYNDDFSLTSMISGVLVLVALHGPAKRSPLGRYSGRKKLRLHASCTWASFFTTQQVVISQIIQDQFFARVSTTLYLRLDSMVEYGTPMCDRISLPRIVVRSVTSEMQPHLWIIVPLAREL